jgi:hypothetical protein
MSVIEDRIEEYIDNKITKVVEDNTAPDAKRTSIETFLRFIDIVAATAVMADKKLKKLRFVNVFTNLILAYALYSILGTLSLGAGLFGIALAFIPVIFISFLCLKLADLISLPDEMRELGDDIQGALDKVKDDTLMSESELVENFNTFSLFKRLKILIKHGPALIAIAKAFEEIAPKFVTAIMSCINPIFASSLVISTVMTVLWAALSIVALLASWLIL